ncbi:MAG: hypothetical protein U0X40_07900 [Ferruginibacter sp.]
MKRLRFLFTILLIAGSVTACGQRHIPVLPPGALQELQLTPQQKEAMKELIREYRMGEIRRKRMLRRRLVQLLDFEQRMRLRRWIRLHQTI